ncbi:helix-turn-helix domain-containing protein (plasmid) [Paenibacillus thiaminolyticus]|uniref:helix-turn-helix domain-containing protein n=1 Tax=Paenibacillus thiaminolyticus TaxID=49283 RepID=UPI0023309E5C|nr:helix-turn-helix domain-containing protein [Paenibacillus thiaminolyticus]WCF11391.1 helix-turn-helix domain-containing protein [Paenibacillus thiaminolyticus]
MVIYSILSFEMGEGVFGVILSIGELIKTYRQSADMTLAQLSELSGIHKGTISKIENNDVKRPEYMTVRPLVEKLNIPLDEYVKLHIEVDKRADTLMFILKDLIHSKVEEDLIYKVANKFLESPSDDSLSLLERLYVFSSSLEDDETKIILYRVIINYSRDHSIMQYLAKGLYQTYLIERNDFSRLRAVYDSGKHLVQYTKFLSSEERNTLHYKLGIHAFNLFLYEQSIDFCLKVLQEAHEEDMNYINALGVLRDSYFYREDYVKSEEYSLRYKQYDYPHIKVNGILMEALINGKKGKTDLAVTQLKSFLETANQDASLPAINQLIHIYLKENELHEIKLLLEKQKINPSNISNNNPYIIYELAEYYYHKGEYYIVIGEFQKGLSDLLEAAWQFSRINATDHEKKCINMVVRSHLSRSAVMTIPTLEKLKSYYERSTNKEGKLEGIV